MSSAEDALASVSLFAGLGSQEIRALSEASRPCRYPKGTIVCHEGDPGGFLLVLLSGRAKVVLQSEQGQEIILSVVEPPDVLGDISLLDGAPRSATVVALDDMEGRRLARDDFLGLLRKNPDLLDRTLRGLAARLRETNEHVRTVLMFDIHGQVLRMLVARGAELDESHIVVRPRPSHQEIAQMIGKSRETVSRALGELKEAGYITVEAASFTLKKDRLRRYWHG